MTTMTRLLVLTSVVLTACGGGLDIPDPNDNDNDNDTRPGRDPDTETEPGTDTRECDVVDSTTPFDLVALEPEYTVYRAGATPESFSDFDLAIFHLEFYEADEGTFALGQGALTNYDSCGQCVFVLAGSEGSDETHLYLADGGTLTVNDSPLDGDLQATLEDVTFIEVTLVGETRTSVPVPDGQCLRVPNTLTISVAAQ